MKKKPSEVWQEGPYPIGAKVKSLKDGKVMTLESYHKKLGFPRPKWIIDHTQAVCSWLDNGDTKSKLIPVDELELIE